MYISDVQTVPSGAKSCFRDKSAVEIATLLTHGGFVNVNEILKIDLGLLIATRHYVVFKRFKKNFRYNRGAFIPSSLSRIPLKRSLD